MTKITIHLSTATPSSYLRWDNTSMRGELKVAIIMQSQIITEALGTFSEMFERYLESTKCLWTIKADGQCNMIFSTMYWFIEEMAHRSRHVISITFSYYSFHSATKDTRVHQDQSWLVHQLNCKSTLKPIKLSEWICNGHRIHHWTRHQFLLSPVKPL